MPNKCSVRHKLELLYIIYFDDCLTVECFADNHNLTTKRANAIIGIGRTINQRR